MDAFEIVFQAVIGLTLLFALYVLLNNALCSQPAKAEPVEPPTVPIRMGVGR
jgi:hypothetical protein